MLFLSRPSLSLPEHKQGGVWERDCSEGRRAQKRVSELKWGEHSVHPRGCGVWAVAAARDWEIFRGVERVSKPIKDAESQSSSLRMEK